MKPFIIGQCIYCDSKTPLLTREHVVPRGLATKWAGHHGALVLQKASCEECRLKTHEFETACLEKMFGTIRERLGLSRRDRRPEKVKALLRDEKGNTSEIWVSPGDVPAFLIFPLFNPQPALFLPPGAHKFAMVGAIAQAVEIEPEIKVQAYEVGANFEFDIVLFQRMLAKIAYATAVHHYGIGKFQPLVREFIRGTEDATGRYVWMFDFSKKQPPAFENGTHNIRLREEKRGETKYIYGLVRLFATYGSPTYGVVVGIKDQAP
jgi:hypothetical protein